MYMLSQILVCLLVLAVGMIVYGVGRLIYVLVPSFSWTSSPIRQICWKSEDVNIAVLSSKRWLTGTIYLIKLMHEDAGYLGLIYTNYVRVEERVRG